jgi:hypothetical protein
VKASFEVRGEPYELEMGRRDDQEGEAFVIYEATVRPRQQGEIKGTLKLTAQAVEAAAARGDKEGRSAEDWLARGCARSVAAELVIRSLKPEFNLVVDHRWVEGAPGT